jgi:hypothetical protein
MEAYDCHESTTATLSISNLRTCCYQRTILRFLYGDHPRTCGGSLKGQEERANVGICHLKRCRSSQQNVNNQSKKDAYFPSLFSQRLHDQALRSTWSQSRLGSIDPVVEALPRPRSLQTFSSRTSLWQIERPIVYMMMDLLNRPCLICFVASESTESNSTNILTIIPVIIGVGGISV